MFLKSIEAQGFKSFPDKTTLTFEEGITGVVGPNGSGKSNISDAVRWVLGEQSNKQLRGEKSEDVIFNGTADRKPQGMASVTLCLNNEDRALPCDADEVAVTRRYYRSGESEYQINHATVRLKDVNELFMDTGLGRDGYSMIGQGKISDIVGRRSDERRDMLEEAAGISRYRYRKQEAERKLAATEDNLVRLRDILAELRERVGPLEEQSKKALRYLDWSKEAQTLEIGLWLRSLAQFEEKLQAQAQKLDVATADYEQVQREAEEARRQAELAGEQVRALTVQMDEARRQAAQMEEEAARREGEAAVAETTLRHNRETRERMEQEMAGADQSGEELQRQLAEKQAVAAQKRAALAEKQAALAALAEESQKLAEETAALARKGEEHARTLERLQQAMAESRLQNVTALSSAQEISHRTAAVEEAFARSDSQLKKLAEEAEALSQDLEENDKRLAECENVVKGAAMLLAAANEQAAAAKRQQEEFTLESQSLLRRAALLEEMERSLEGFNQTVRRLAAESARGTLGGIKGTVSQLIKVKEPHATAIEVALGGALQHVVTAREQDAKQAIAYLKREKAGRATFLPVDTVKPRTFRETGLSNCPGFVGMADRLVECDDAYRAIVSSLLGAVAVAEDLDAAAAIGKRYGYRFRVVTLDGQVVNAGGSLTGGSFNRSAGLLSRRGELLRLREKAEQVKAQAAAAAGEKQAAEEKAAALAAKKQAAESEQMTAREDRVRLLAECRRVEQQQADEAAAREALQQEQQTAEERLRTLRQQAGDADNLAEELQRQLQEAEGQKQTAAAKNEALAARREELAAQTAALRLEATVLEKEEEAAEGLAASRWQKSATA